MVRVSLQSGFIGRGGLLTKLVVAVLLGFIREMAQKGVGEEAVFEALPARQALQSLDRQFVWRVKQDELLGRGDTNLGT